MTAKIGLIADLHGHIDALNRALDLLESLAVDEIICAGDLVDKGEYSEDVVTLIRERNIPTVMGNHDMRAIATKVMMRKNPAYAERIATLPHFSADTLSEETITYLESLPQTLTFEWEDVKILMAHGTPRSPDVYVFPLSTYLARNIAKETDAEIVVLGHTHMPMVLQVEDTLIINPGSVYANYEHDLGIKRTCGVLELPSKTFTLYGIDDRKVYDVPVQVINLED